jgi:hypothetical protein
LRIGNAIELRRKDVQDKRLTQKETKSGKEHEILIVPETVTDMLGNGATKKFKNT